MQYVPVLKVRPAEMGALGVTPTDQIRPLLELMPLPPASAPKPDEKPKKHKTLEKHLLDQLKIIGSGWGTQPVMVDFVHVLNINQNSSQAIKDFSSSCKDEGVRLIPVVNTKSSMAQLPIIKHILTEHGNGYAIRVAGMPDTWQDSSESVDVFISLLDRDISEIDLVFDVESLKDQPIVEISRSAIENIPRFTRKSQWRSVALVAGSYPSSNPTENDALIPRLDANLWRQTRDALPHVDFGDYGIESTTFGLQSIPTLSSLLKYTLQNHWWFMREEGVKGEETGERKENGKPKRKPGKKGDFRILCRKLISSDRFMQPEYSWGDNALHSRATAPTTGLGAERRQAMFSHHFAVVLEELNATLSETVPEPPTRPAAVELPF